MSGVLEMGPAMTRPGADTRQWVSMGLVSPETPDARSVTFDPKIGPLVNVTLEPSGIPVVCRVAAQVAGILEGEWFPFLPGDEVVVAVPEGNERAGCVIIGRTNNGVDLWPATVAGQDATKNTFGFKRFRTPFVIETAASFSIRSALTGANLTFDQTGNLFLVSGDGHKLFFGADGIQVGDQDGNSLLQIDADTGEVLLQSKTAQLLVSEDACHLVTPGDFEITTNGVIHRGHAVTLEQVVCLLVNFLYLIKMAGDPSTWATTIFNPADTTLATLGGYVATWLASATAPTPPTPAAGGGNFIAFVPPILGPLGSIEPLVAAQVANQDPTGFIPGIGRPHFRY